MKLFRVDKDAKFIQYAERDFKKEKNDVDADKKERFFAVLSSIVERIKSQFNEEEK